MIEVRAGAIGACWSLYSIPVKIICLHVRPTTLTLMQEVAIMSKNNFLSVRKICDFYWLFNHLNWIQRKPPKLKSTKWQGVAETNVLIEVTWGTVLFVRAIGTVGDKVALFVGWNTLSRLARELIGLAECSNWGENKTVGQFVKSFEMVQTFSNESYLNDGSI